MLRIVVIVKKKIIIMGRIFLQYYSNTQPRNLLLLLLLFADPVLFMKDKLYKVSRMCVTLLVKQEFFMIE